MLKTDKKDKKMEVLNNDIIFKNIFNVKETLKRLLKETLDLNVKDVFLANTEMPVEKISERRKILDLVVYTENEVINVEVNNAYKEDLYIRNFLYFLLFSFLLVFSMVSGSIFTKIIAFFVSFLYNLVNLLAILFILLYCNLCFRRFYSVRRK